MENKNMVVMKTLKLKRKALLMLAVLLTGGVASAQVVVKGSVYGGGQGTETDVRSGGVTGNATVTMNGGTVERSIYGGGELGSVGTFTDSTLVQYTLGNNAGKSVYIPKTCQDGTGLTTVIVNGGNVGVSERTKMPVTNNTYGDDYGYVFGAGRGEGDSITYYKAVALGVSGNAITEINDTAFIHGSVYGGSENGLVLGNTRVAISGGQIGDGYYKDGQGVEHWDGLYTEAQWDTAIVKIKDGTFSADDAAGFHECDHWPYQAPYQPYDPYGNQGQPIYGSNGYTTYGNVFGGGSGYYPIAPGIWRRTAGQVNGNSEVVVTGGHILTSIYGGNEMTDVLGNSKVTMTGGTLGVPRTLADIAAHPVTCYLFGAGKGDQRTTFNTWTNVKKNVEVKIGGNAFFFGSVFGGGEDGHVLGNVTVKITTETDDDAFIGTWGYSYVDGNVFGGGRGFSGDALTAGSVGGNVELNIGGGTMLGSIYGGGRLASVGTYFVGPDDDNYGQMQPDEGDETHGHIAINITGGTIGNDYEAKYHRGINDHGQVHTTGGNVYGGSMGRLELLDGTTTNPLWPNLAKAKATTVSISGDNTIVKGSVFGGSELGTLTEEASVIVEGGTIWRSVFGGGFGSDDITKKAPLQVNGSNKVTPMQRAGQIEGNTSVAISGGWVKKNVYGGGGLASTGIVTDSIQHSDESTGFALSWPYQMTYKENTGTNTVSITGGRIGLTGKDFMGPWNAEGVPLIKLPDSDNYVAYNASQTGHKDALKAAREDNGDVYGAAKGHAGDRYVMAHSANADNTVVNINYTNTDAEPTNYKPDDWVYAFYEKASEWSYSNPDNNLGCIAGGLYGGPENGHVNSNTDLTLEKGLIGHSLYGGGKGSDTYKVTLYHWTEDPDNPDHYIQGESYQANVTSITGGKVYGNTNVTVNDGYVVRNVYGGGNRASVGKGNYAGGPGDYNENGYGEQWTSSNAEELRAILANSGHTYININGGVIGTPAGMHDDLPTGNVLGGSRGEPAPSVPQTLTPRILYYPEFFLGYVNHSHVTIGKADGTGGTPRLYGNVFGGGEDGHVRWSTNVTVNKGEIGNPYVDAATATALAGTPYLTDIRWMGRGNVFGSGSGLGQYEDESGLHYSPSAGSVTQFTEVTINGGTIHRNVYGGGSLATVGPPKMGQPAEPADDEVTLAKVNINGTVGVLEDVVERSYVIAGGGSTGNDTTIYCSYGGNVFGGSRGPEHLNLDQFSNVVFTEVNIGKTENNTTTPGYVLGNVYGGGELGKVRQDTKVNMNAGEVGTMEYTYKTSNTSHSVYDSIYHKTGGELFGGGMGLADLPEAARVKRNTEVNISGGQVYYNVYGGGEMASVGQHTEALADPNNPNSEVIDFIPVANTGLAKVTVTGGQVGPAPKVDLANGYNIPIGLNGVDGYVFGGGMGIGDDTISTTYPSGQYYQIANVNYTSVTVDITSSDTINNRLWGSVFGGSEDGHVLGSDTVRFVSGFLGTKGTTSWDGNIFGGGRNFSKKNYTAGRTRGNNTVEMTGGQIFGNIYGGGRLALTGTGLRGLTLVSGTTDQYTPMITGDYGKTKVMVKGGIVGNNKLIETFTAHSMGNVYGGGMGDMGGINVQGHPAASALLLGMTKNTEVEISGGINDTHVYGIVFGGGETANVGQYTWKQVGTTVSDITITEGLAKVTVSGGTIGGDRSQMRYDLEDPADPTNYWSKYNDDLGYVYGGGEGVSEDPTLYPLIQENATTQTSLLDLMATVNNTEVTVSGGWVKASVFGGAESGHVRGNTKVTVSGGQIGAGYSRNENNQIVDVLYDPTAFVNPIQTPSFTSLNGTYHWDYGREVSGDTIYTPFDPAEIRNNAVYDASTQTTTYNYIPSDGKSWFGNVFGGGSGWFPYVKYNTTTQKYESHWNPNSGKVWGDTEVNITGGHILNNVYGANESTDVGGMAVVKMSGGTVGVPRDVEEIPLHPIISNVYGGGCGDPRTIFNSLNNVDSTYVQITGGIVYGNVFGGAEEGHVLDSTVVFVDGGIIGTSGLSGYDGHVFGGGKGKDTYLNVEDMNFAAGRVGGNTHVIMTGGNVLGNIYGGGNVARTGVGVVGDYESFIDAESHVYDSTYHGRTMVEISGGFIGNNAHDGLDLLNSDNDLGNIYGGGRGKSDDFIEDDWGRVANAIIKISGSPFIYSSVFGGGQMANVGHWNNYDDWYTAQTGATHVTISGSPTIGTEKEFTHYSDADDLWTWYDTINGLKMISHTCTGNVFGGGQGDVEVDYGDDEIIGDETVVGLEQGHCRTTIVDISGNPIIMSSVFGGSEDGMVWGDTKVNIAGGTIGQQELHSLELNESNQWVVSSQTYSYGNVFGGSYGKDAITHLEGYDPEEMSDEIMNEVNSKAGLIHGNTYVEITGGTIRGNVFGGSNYGSVVHDTEVKVSGTAVIGPLDHTGLNAYVFGGGKGFRDDPDELRKAFANVDNTKVTVSGGKIWGSIFGGGSDAHVLGNTEIYVHEGADIGDDGLSTWDGNIFGGGRNFLNSNHTNGRVAGNVSITMDGGAIQGSIFGGGRLALTGVDVDGNPFLTESGGHVYDAEHHGMVTVTVSGTTTRIGNPDGEQLLKGSDESVGDIFGSGKGDTKEYDDVWAGRVANTKITVKGSPRIYGSVFGGGEMASIGYWYTDNSDPTHPKSPFYENSGASEVIIGETSSDNPVIGTDMEYTAEYAQDPGNWTIYGDDGKLIHTCTGNVFGASQGDIDIECSHWVSMGRSRTSKVTVNGGTIKSGVFGGAEQGTVAGNTSVTINGGTIGTVVTPASGSSYNFGHVIGGGYGCDEEADLDETTNDSIALGGNLWRSNYLAGRVYGHSRVYFNNGTLKGDVFGGGNRGIVDQERVTNINGGTVEGDVFGGGNTQTTNETIGDVVHKSLKTVNVRGGHIKGSVFGCSKEVEEGETGVTERLWQAFVNITGGHIDQNVYAAGAGGSVIGSVCLMVGKEAILNAPTYLHPSNPETGNANQFYGDSENGTAINPTASKLLIGGSLFGGSQHYGSSQYATWNQFDITGASATFVDGTEYNMDADTTGKAYMYIGGGIYGSGELCESGASGREVFVRAYGDRVMTDNQVTSTTRPLTTIQRGGVVLIDDSNISFTGAPDISSQATGQYAMLKVDNNLLVAHGSSLILEGTNARPVLMDSIRDMRSVWLKDEVGTAYNQIGASNLPNWEMVGIKDNDNTLYHIKDNSQTALSRDEENVIIFRGPSKLWVRYHTIENGQFYNKYGHLFGFFRMRGDHYQPYGTESFAYARPKITEGSSTDNIGDGGFLSYNNDYNFFTDAGDPFTKTMQHPYTNVLQLAKGDRIEYREWVILQNNGHKWYVDGTRNWGRDDQSKADGWGLYPDKPKKTLFGAVTYNQETNTGNYGGIVTESLTNYDFTYLKDVIYVVGALSASDEAAIMHGVDSLDYPVKLYRYPGGHHLSNGDYLDWGIGTDPSTPNTNTGLPSTGTDEEKHAGPGPNYGAMLKVQNGADLTLLNDHFDGLYGFQTDDIELHGIPTAWPEGTPSSAKVFDPSLVSEPLVVTEAGATLTLKGGTTLMRGYNNTDAATTWYYDADYAPTGDVHHGGALFVAADVPEEGENPAQVTTVNVEGMVTITGNLQKKGDGTVNSNVYLPTFDKSLNISGSENLNVDTRIGVTSPKRNTDEWYHDNTLSPVAVASTASIAQNAWVNRNFLDDQGWFFVSGHTGANPRTTYYNGAGTKGRDNRTLYFGWTWANVVRTAPAGYSDTDIDSPEDLAWLISSVPTGSMKQTADVDMKQYVWVPIGNEVTPFIGNYDGQGHLIKNLYIDYIGTGDLRYERTNYGMFGNVVNGTVNRTFVVSGEYKPFVSDLNGTTGKNIGGLVGSMDGTSTVSNSEAAVRILDFNNDATVTGNVMGGLVAKMSAGEVHSSMAMSTLSIGQNYKGVLGGLVGVARGGAINNSFANATFSINNNTGLRAGGLIGDNTAATMQNCYVTWHDANTSLTASNFGSLAANNTTSNNIRYCYANENTTGVSFGYTAAGSVDASCKSYSPVCSADMLGYMYNDNKVEGDTAMFVTMNRWVTTANGTGHKYAQWARPGLAYYETSGENTVLVAPINGDLPVLLLDNYNASGKIGAGDFRSMGTYAGGPALQYGGPIRDVKQIDSALVRPKAAEANDYLFVYGDITEKIAVESGKSITQSKISIHEDAAIMDAGVLSDYDNTYVGVTFDNSFGAATSTPGVNYGLNGLGMGGYPLPRDWHMFSSPLQNAPLGFDYKGDNIPNSTNVNNPWVSWGNEFSWLQSGGSTNVRYWMYGWDNSLSQSVDGTAVNLDTWRDGYFPSEATTFGTGLISGSDEDGCFPYGMDLYTWTEPDYHWINFKRNGPNHWHSDEDHDGIDYKPYGEVTDSYPANKNEDNLIVGRGYMASIATGTFMQSHGRLNSNDPKEILLTSTTTSKLQGWNLVGNPFHGYLDFNVVGDQYGPNNDVLNVHGDEGAFYVVYNADKYNNGDANTAFRYYPVNGSVGGDYANRYIHPHQGFYVSAKERGNLQFTKEMLVDRTTVGDANHMRDEMPAYPLVNLYLSSDQGCADVTVIEFERPEWGGARKIKELRVGDGLFYAHHGDTKYAALFAQTGIDRVPLWFEAKEDDIFTMKWNLANADFHSMYLIDNIAGVQYDMLRNNTYSFEGHKGDYPSRFLIVFSLTDVDEHQESNGFVFFDGSQWMVTGEGDLEFIDALGQVLMRKHVSGGQSRVGVPDVAPGVYLFRLTNTEGTRVQKVIVKR